MKNQIILIATTAILTGCGTYTPRQVAEPSSITLRKAVFDVATTLRDVQSVTPPDKKTGMMADEATVTFNIAASSKTTNSGELSISNVPLAKGAVTGSIGTENISEGSTGNQIIIKFKNIATADMSKGIYSVVSSRSPSKTETSKDEKKSGNNEPAVRTVDIRELCKQTKLCLFNAPVDGKLKINIEDKTIFPSTDAKKAD